LRFAFAPSEFHAQLLVRAGLVPAAKMHALPLGLPPADLERAAALPVHRPRPGRLRLVCFGNLSRLKGLDLVFEAMRPLAARGVELEVFGSIEPTEEESLRRAAAG